MTRLTFATVIFLFLGIPCFGQSLPDELKAAANHVAQVMKQENATAVRVGEFIGDDAFTKGTGAKVQAGLIDALVIAEVKIDEKSPFKLSGTFEVVTDKEGNLPETIAIQLTLNIKRGSTTLDKFTRKSTISHKSGGNADVIELIASPINLKNQGKAIAEDRNKQLPKQLKKPPVHFENTKVLLEKEGLFSVEIVAGPAGKDPTAVRQPFLKDDIPHVKMDKGEEYRIRIHNCSKGELAMGITVDGVDRAQFFQPAKDRPGLLLVGAGQTVEVKGWRVNAKKVTAFQVGALADSEAVKLKGLEQYKGLNGSSDIGLIAVTAHPSWEKGKEPADRSRDIGTLQGRPIDSPAKIVERTIGPALGKIVVRYEKK